MTTGVLIVPEPCCRRIIKASGTSKSPGIETFTGTAFHTRLVRSTFACNGPRQSLVLASEDLSENADLSAENLFSFSNKPVQFRYCLHNLSTPHVRRRASFINRTFRGESFALILMKFPGKSLPIRYFSPWSALFPLILSFR